MRTRPGKTTRAPECWPRACACGHDELHHGAARPKGGLFKPGECCDCACKSFRPVASLCVACGHPDDHHEDGPCNVVIGDPGRRPRRCNCPRFHAPRRSTTVPREAAQPSRSPGARRCRCGHVARVHEDGSGSCRTLTCAGDDRPCERFRFAQAAAPPKVNSGAPSALRLEQLRAYSRRATPDQVESLGPEAMGGTFRRVEPLVGRRVKVSLDVREARDLLKLLHALKHAGAHNPALERAAEHLRRALKGQR